MGTFFLILLIVLMFASINSPVAGIFLGIVFLGFAYRSQIQTYKSNDDIKLIIVGYPLGIFCIINGFYRLCNP